MTMNDEAVFELMKARRLLDQAHKAACAAMARFQTVKDEQSLPLDERLAARSLLDQTVPLCKAILCAMQAVPEVAGLKPETGNLIPEKELPCNRTAKSLLDEFMKKREQRVKGTEAQGAVATSARFGRPIVAAMAVLVIAFIPMAGKADTVERVIDALVQIESSGRPAVTGDNGKAVGLLQLHPVAVREANRIAGSNRWKLSDRTCPAKSRAMARTILTWHYRRGVTDPVELACRWNKPFGQTTTHYRSKAVAALREI